MNSTGLQESIGAPKRNDPCPCGSGKKFKKCCQGTTAVPQEAVVKSSAQALEIAVQHHKAGRFSEALVIYEELRKDDPRHPEALNLSGVIAFQSGAIELAAELIGRAIEARPDYAEANYNLGLVLQTQGRLTEAVACYNKALLIGGVGGDCLARVCNNLSSILALHYQLLEALGYALRAVEFNPGSGEAHQSVASMMAYLSDFSDVCADSDAALALEPDDYYIRESRLYCYSYHPDLSAQEIFSEFVRWGDRFPAIPAYRFIDHDRTPGRRLRIGYVSPDFRRHTSRFFFEPLFAHHDKAQVELFAYSNVRKDREDEHTERFRTLFDQWRDIRDLSDDDAADLVHRDRIDILVDCCNHMQDDRLGLFVRKPAPIQATWLGAAWTTGLATVDYVLFDQYMAPEGTLAREKIVRLPGCFVAYRPPPETAEVVLPPSLNNGYVTFGYSGRSERLNHRVFLAWGEILRRLPDARLILDYAPFADPLTQGYYREFLSKQGVDVSRVTLRKSANIFEGLGDIDILLDCFPHSGGTMLFDALWMGVPALTLAGRPPVGRIGTSLMMNLGLPEWVTYSEDEYIRQAVAVAQDSARLTALRAGMRERMRNSPLMDEQGFACGVEDALRAMWQTWCEEQP